MTDIDRFLTGIDRFRTKYFIDQPGSFAQLSKAQQPTALVIACCDSRVDPAILTGADPGDLFIVRDVANLVPPYQDDSHAPGIRAAIEFAVKGLEVENIIVLGHSRCGGIKALMDGEGITEHHYEFIGPWVSLAKPARDEVMRDMPHETHACQTRACEQAAIRMSLENLLSFPWIAERVQQNRIALHGWYFDIETGNLLVYSAEDELFRPMAVEPA
jgi:carbonic anhydrase